MKIAIGCIIGVVSLVIVYCLIYFFAFGGGTLFLPSPPKPEIKYAEFNFTLTCEIEGEVRELSDTLVCEFDGYSIDEGRGKTRKWKKYYKSEPKDDRILLHQIDDTLFITLGVGVARYFMSDPDFDYGVPENPYISVYDSATGYYLGGTQEEKELLEQCGFKIVSWHCDPPIKNTFK